jgi:hypothetical protein
MAEGKEGQEGRGDEGTWRCNAVARSGSGLK